MADPKNDGFDNSVMNPDRRQAGIVESIFKGGLGGFLGATAGMGTASIDGVILMDSLFRQGKSVTDALKDASVTRTTLPRLGEATGLPMTEEQAAQGSVDMQGAFAVGGALAPSRGRGGVGGAAGRTAWNTGVNLGVEGVTRATGNDLLGLPLSMVPGMAGRTAREAVIARYSSTLTPDQIKRIQDGTITLGEITNNPAILRQEQSIRTDPSTAGPMRQFDQNAAATIRDQLQSAKPNVSVTTAGSTPAPVTPSKLVGSIYKAYETQINKLDSNIKARADRDYALPNKFVPGNKRWIDPTLIVAEIDQQIASNKGLKQTDETKAIIGGLERLRNDFFDVTTIPAQYDANGYMIKGPQEVKTIKNLTNDELRQQLSQWTQKSYNGDGLFDGVSGDQGKRIAGKILGSYKMAIDDVKASTDPNKYKSPQKMKQNAAINALDNARSNYARGMDRMNTFKERELSRYFGSVENVSQLTSSPEKALMRIEKLGPEEREVALRLLRDNAPEADQLIQGMRAMQWQRMIDKATPTGRSDAAIPFDVNKFLSQMDSADAKLLADMIPDPAQRAEVMNTLVQMRIMARKGDWSIATPGNRSGEVTAALATATGSRAIEASLITRIMDDIQKKVVGPEKLLELVTNPQFRGNSIGERVANFAKAGGNILDQNATDLGRVGRAAQDVLAAPVEEEPITDLPAPPEGLLDTEAQPDLPPPPEGLFDNIGPTPGSNAPSLQVDPAVQAERDGLRKQLLTEELNNAQSPQEAEALQRELARMQ
jgi:hypothetical protein